MYSQKNQVFPQDYSCIIDPVLGKGGLYIGNLQAAQNINTLKKLQIKAVLTSCKGIQLNHPKTQVPYFLYVPAEDHESCDISKYFNQASSFIKDCLQRTNIMVHCMAGVSRSVTLSISYLIKYKRMTFNQAFNLVKSRRKIICPNDGFIDLLKRFQRDLPPIQEKEEIRFYSPVKTSSYADLSAFSYSPKKDPHHQHNIDSIISKYQNYKVGKAFEKNPQTQPYSYQQNLQTSVFSSLKPSKLKRYTSVNVEADNYIQTSPSRQQNDQYSRLMNTNSVRPFNNIQNTVNKLNNTEFGDIDKRIEQIRQKYTFESSARPSNYKYECQRSVKYPIEQSRYRARASSGYNDYKKARESRDYYNYLPQRDPILFMDKKQSFASTYSRGNMPQMSSKQLKRLTSLQQY